MKVKELLSTPDKWTQGAFARDKDNNSRSVVDYDAHCFCLLGAVEKCYGETPEEFADMKIKLFKTVYKHTWFNDVAKFNDCPTTTFEDICHIIELADI